MAEKEMECEDRKVRCVVSGSSTFYFYFGGLGPCLDMLRDYSWLCVQE